MWVARDEDGVLALYRTKPKRIHFNWFDRHIFRKKDCWRGTLLAYLDKNKFSDLSWEDEPRGVYVGIFDRKHMQMMFEKFGYEVTNEIDRWLDDLCG